MSKYDVTAGLPAPLSLTLEEASKVAAGTFNLALVASETWWWKGQPAWLNPAVNPAVNPANAVGGFVANA